MDKSEVLQEEIEWFEKAYENSKDKNYTQEYRKGFKSAIGWLKLHRDMALTKESFDRVCRCEATEHVPDCPSWGTIEITEEV